MTAAVFKLFANCIPVRGARRSLLCDLQTGRLKLIPNSLFEVLTEHKDRPPEDIKAAYQHQFDTELDEYFAFLVGQGWGFWCEEPESFPDLDLSYDIPERITNAVIDSDRSSKHDYVSLIDQLEDLGCKHIQFRFFDPVPLSEIEKVAEASRNRRLRGIELLAPFGPEFEDREQLTEWCRRYPRIVAFTLTGAPAYLLEHTSPTSKFMGLLVYHPDKVHDHTCCGVIDKAYFTVSMPTFTEALHFNSCLNRKISVDAKGCIKNCPSLKQSFGHSRDTKLHEALESEGFQDIWSITKDRVSICKDCEFRYVCTDCRAVTEEDDPLGKPARCGYDPYTATWQRDPTLPFPV